MGRGTNQPRLGDFNQSVILDVIRRSRGGIGRAELARRTGLTPQSITRITRRLLDDDLLVEGDTVPSAAGRPSALLTLSPEGGYAVGIHLDPTTVTLTVLDITGWQVSRRTLPTPGLQESGHALDQIAEQVELVIADASVSRTRVHGVGIAAPGPVNAARGELVDPPNMPAWGGVPLRAGLSERLGLAVLLDKDVVAAAVAEQWSRPDAAESFVFFYLGAGVGAGVVIDGEVVRGISGNAGEIGHLGTGAATTGCTLGHVGCVGFACVPWAMAIEARAAGILSGPDRPVSDIVGADRDFAELCALADAGHEGAGEIIDRSAVRVAKVATDMANFLDLGTIVLGGPLWPLLSERYLAVVPGIVQESLVANRIHRVSVEATVVGSDVGAIGGACLVLDHAFAPQRSALLLS